MNETNLELLFSSIAIVVSTVTIMVSWKTMAKTTTWQKEDIKMRRDIEEKKN